MKIQLINIQELNADHYYGENLKDPINIKKLSLEERQVYKEFGITHVMDMRSLFTLYEIYFMKYIWLKEGSYFEDLKNEKIKLEFFNPENIPANDGIEGYKVWDENLFQRTGKKLPYVKYMEFLQKEIPILNYQLYNLVFTKLNAINYEEWKNSYVLIADYMHAYNQFRVKNKELLDKLKLSMKEITSKNYFDRFFTFVGHSNSSINEILNSLIDEAYEDAKNVFWNKNRKKEERKDIINSPAKYLKQLVSYCNWHHLNNEVFKSLYNLSSINEMKNKNEPVEGSLIDNVENINYRQFFLEALTARSLTNSLDPLEIQDFGVLQEHGVRLVDLSLNAKKLMYQKSARLFFKHQGSSRIKDNFEKLYREIDMSKKLEKMDLDKAVNSVKKKI